MRLATLFFLLSSACCDGAKQYSGRAARDKREPRPTNSYRYRTSADWSPADEPERHAAHDTGWPAKRR